MTVGQGKEMRTASIGRVTFIWQGSSDIMRVAVVTKNQGAGVKVRH